MSESSLSPSRESVDAGLAVMRVKVRSVSRQEWHWPGNSGVINAQIGPTGFIQWNIVDHTDNGGR